MKKEITKIFSYFPFIKNYFQGIATIFMLHRVDDIDNDKLPPNENMKVSPKFLEDFIIKLKKEGYCFISLDELYEIINKKKKVKKCIVFTLDDGYKDNFTKAYPIFKSLNIPFTIYITTSFPNKKAILWWYVLEELILRNNELKIQNKIFKCTTYEEKVKSFLQIREIILNLNQKNLLNELNNIFKDYEIDWYKFNNELCMDWNDIKILSKDNLCIIGNHTKNHYALNKLEEKEIISEILEANKEIERKINKKIEHFAYPFGSSKEVGKREFDIVKNLNFKTVTTTRAGNIYLKHKNFVDCCLPRIMLTENFDIRDLWKIKRKRIVTV